MNRSSAGRSEGFHANALGGDQAATCGEADKESSVYSLICTKYYVDKLFENLESGETYTLTGNVAAPVRIRWQRRTQRPRRSSSDRWCLQRSAGG